MAERAINWNRFIHHTTFGAPPAEWQRVREIAQQVWSRPFAQKVRAGVTEATTAWWENVNPAQIRNKDLAWRIGLVVGLAESAAFTFLVPIPGSGLVKGAVNTAVTQGAFFGARALHINAEDWIKNIAKGVSAGGLYLSLPSGIAKELIGVAVPDVTKVPDAILGAVRAIRAPSLPTLPDVTKAPAAVRDATVGFFKTAWDRVSRTWNAARDTEARMYNEALRRVGLRAEKDIAPPAAPPVTRPEIPPTQPLPAEPVLQPEVVTSQPPVAVPTDVEPAKPVIEIAISKMEQNKDFMNSLAANVDEKLPVENEVIVKALVNQGLSVHDLSPEALQSARAAVQNALENQVNTSGSEVLQTIVSGSPDIDISSEAAVNLAKKATKANFEAWLDSSVGQDKLMEAVQDTLSQQVAIMPSAGAKIAQFLAENQASSELFTEHIVKPGETAGHLLLRMGADVRWDGTDWPAFALLNMMNPVEFAELRTATGLSPVEFAELLKKFRNGDQQAYKILIRHMGLIKAGSRVRLLTASGMRQLLASLRS